MTIMIREIQEEDYKDVLSLWNNELGNKWATIDNLTVTYEQMKNREEYQTFVAIYNGLVVGMITTVIVMAVGFPMGYMKINGLAVKKGYQGKGIGKMLIQQIEDVAHQKGITSIGLATGFQRKQAHAFYEHLGYESGSYWYGKMVN